MAETKNAQAQSSTKGLDAGKKAEAKVPAGQGSSTSYDKIAELAYDSEMKHEGDTHQIFFDLLDQGAQKNHINLGTGSALMAGRKYNEAVGTVNVTVGDNKNSGKQLTFTNANALDKAILDALPYVSTVKYFQSQYPGTKAYKNGGKAAKNLYASTVASLKALSGTISDGKNSATAKFTGKMGYVNIYLSDEDVAQVKKVNIDADFNFGDNVTSVFKRCLTREEDAQNVVFKGFIHGIHAKGSMPKVYKHFGKDANNLRILEDAVKKNEGTNELVQALYKSIEASLSTKWHDPFKRDIDTYIKGKGRNTGSSSGASKSSKGVEAAKKTAENSGKVAENSGVGAPTTTGNEQVYVVKSGDTLSKIAAQFNVTGGYKAIASLNDISDPSRISVGQKLRIPGTIAAATPVAKANTTEPNPNAAGNAGGAGNAVSGNEKSATGQKVVDYAAQFIGHTYVWGGKGQVISKNSLAWLRKTYGSKSTSFKGMTTWAQRYDWIVANRAGERAFDCSGLCVYSYRNAAKDVGAERPSESAAVKVFKSKPALSEMKVGDVIVSSGHYQMYYGNGKAIESCSSKGVTNTLAWDYNGVKAVYRYFDD